MFTGLIEDVGKIQSVEPLPGGMRLAVSTQLDLASAKVGDSISVDGVCLTMVKLAGSTFTVEVSPETLQKTTLSAARQGQPVNLEMALRMSDPLGDIWLPDTWMERERSWRWFPKEALGVIVSGSPRRSAGT